ncbi:hypothetical protein AQUCO_02500028v1 [Aquilegia coerulea]|uniref:O-methyltransferase C-terminal domain-containing protein n=1 Tax=Aquilegia coerulea TaxID=218851 RepID=A0A2G5D922_AQUCA|nr:hypothetical protein AQUCO_02500028v1 [Aquilegia coerulea]
MKKLLQLYEGFEGLKCVIDVGSGTGATINKIVTKHPTIKGINFDLPHVIDVAPAYPGVEHIQGDMFVNVLKADAIFMKYFLRLISHPIVSSNLITSCWLHNPGGKERTEKEFEVLSVESGFAGFKVVCSAFNS